MTGAQVARQGIVFAAIFFVVNLAIDAWRANAVSPGAVSSAAIATAFATPVYLLLTWLFLRRRENDE